MTKEAIGAFQLAQEETLITSCEYRKGGGKQGESGAAFYLTDQRFIHQSISRMGKETLVTSDEIALNKVSALEELYLQGRRPINVGQLVGAFILLFIGACFLALAFLLPAESLASLLTRFSLSFETLMLIFKIVGGVLMAAGGIFLLVVLLGRKNEFAFLLTFFAAQPPTNHLTVGESTFLSKGAGTPKPKKITIAITAQNREVREFLDVLGSVVYGAK